MAKIKKACKGALYPKSSSVSSRLKKGGSFPDLNKDGKITKKDILIGKGVLPKTAKKGKMVKKAASKKAMKKAPPMMMPPSGSAPMGGGPMMKKGGKMAKKGMHKMPDGSMMKNSMMKKGGKMTKKCAYGCK